MTATAIRTTTVAGIEVPTDHYIGGERVGSDATFETLSPLDGRVLAEVARGGEREADLAVRAAHDAFPEWAALGAVGRAAAPAPARRPDRRARRAARRRRVRRHGDAAALAARAGDRPRRAELPQLRRPRPGPRGARLALEGHLEPGAADARRARRSSSPRGTRRSCSRPGRPRPRWPPAARSCSSRPSGRRCPARCWPRSPTRPGCPPGVFNVVQGIGEEVGAALVAHPLVRRISFTGSTDDRAPDRPGRRVATSCRSPPSSAARTR